MQALPAQEVSDEARQLSDGDLVLRQELPQGQPAGALGIWDRTESIALGQLVVGLHSQSERVGQRAVEIPEQKLVPSPHGIPLYCNQGRQRTRGGIFLLPLRMSALAPFFEL